MQRIRIHNTADAQANQSHNRDPRKSNDESRGHGLIPRVGESNLRARTLLLKIRDLNGNLWTRFCAVLQFIDESL
jgi:hypothetical protein